MVDNLKRNIKAKLKGDDAEEKIYVFQLFIVGSSNVSINAIKNFKSICETNLNNKYNLEIIDINEQPQMAITENIITLPLLIKRFPLPEEKMFGDFSNTQKVLEFLNITTQYKK